MCFIKKFIKKTVNKFVNKFTNNKFINKFKKEKTNNNNYINNIANLFVSYKFSFESISYIRYFISNKFGLLSLFAIQSKPASKKFE